MRLHPKARACATFMPFAAVLLSRSLLLLLAFWLALLPLLGRHGLLPTHRKFVFLAVAPMLAALLLVWLASSSPPPLAPIDWLGPAGVGYALLIALRILAAGALLQAMMLPLVATGELPATLRSWGVGKQGIQVVASSIALIEDVKRKAVRVADARAARGLMPTGRWRRLKILPALLRPVFFASLESAVARADLWRHRGIDPTSLLDANREAPPWRAADSGLSAAGAAVLAASLATLAS